MAIGKKTGGRRKGTPNRKTAEMRAEMAATGELPLAYMLRIMRDPTVEPHRRDAMAKAAGPYVHPQLQSTTVQQLGPDGQPVGPQLTQIYVDARGEQITEAVRLAQQQIEQQAAPVVVDNKAGSSSKH